MQGLLGSIRRLLAVGKDRAPWVMKLPEDPDDSRHSEFWARS